MRNQTLSTGSEFENISERQLKYELFRALRRGESERAIAILKTKNADPNWRHAYMGWSVLLHAYFEDDPLVFDYLLTRDDLDISLKDDDGHDILFWMRIGGPSKKIDYKARLIEAKGTIAQKLQLLAEEKMEKLYIQSEKTRNEDPNNDPVSLNIGARYRINVTTGPLLAGEIVTYRGTHTEPAERGHDIFDDFIRPSGRIVSIPALNITVIDSFRIFLDVEEDFLKFPVHIRPLVKRLEYRSRSERSNAALSVQSPMHDYQIIAPILVKLALCERGENEFLKALCRIRHEALGLVESLEDPPVTGNTWGYEWILSRMGSTKYLDKYHTMLDSADSMLVRRVVAHIANIGDPASLPVLERIKDHSNFNVRSDVAKALATFRY
jgi:hypothetical protein